MTTDGSFEDDSFEDDRFEGDRFDGDRFDGDRFDGDRDSSDEAAPKPGMSTRVKILIGVLVSGGVLCVLCCGGVWFLAKDHIQVVKTPAEVRAFSEEMIQIDVPEQFVPEIGMKLNFFGVEMTHVAYFDDSKHSILMIMETSQPDTGNAEEQLKQFQKSMEQQGQGGQFHIQELDNQKSETHELVVRGETVPFRFITGNAKGSGEKIRQITGAFPSDDGMIVLMMQLPEEDYDEEAIVKMIESIK